jgi:ribonuclease D
MSVNGEIAIITSEERLKEYLKDLRVRGVRKVALDMEGDQGMFHYRYAVSILQCFDGLDGVIIDVLKMGGGGNDTLREFLTCQDIVKVMFSCGNDVFMSQNVLGCTISPINDISVAQKLLEMPINLTSYLNIDKDLKDSFQRANWLLRPIKGTLLEYAVNDVLKLLDIEEELAAQLVEKGRYDDYIAQSRVASDKKYAVDPHALFCTKFPGYARLPFEKKKLAAGLWIFRELLGERFDCPVGYILPKKTLAAILGSNRELVSAIEWQINVGRKSSKRLAMGLIRELFDKAMQSPHVQHIQQKPQRPQRQPVRRRSQSQQRESRESQ